MAFPKPSTALAFFCAKSAVTIITDAAPDIFRLSAGPWPLRGSTTMRHTLDTSQKPSIGENSTRPSICLLAMAGNAVLGAPTATMVTSSAFMPASLSMLTSWNSAALPRAVTPTFLPLKSCITAG